MNEIELKEAIEFLTSEKKFYKEQLKETEQSYAFLNAEEAYVRGNYEGQEICRNAIECIDRSISALREKAERDKGCEFCNSRFSIAAHHVNEAGLKAGLNKDAKFCPMCGKKLKEAQANEQTEID